MDPLLSLCNLYAEGPRTLRLLERRGVRTLPEVLALPAERLAELLGGSPGAARRFQREATLAAACAHARDPEESSCTPRSDTESSREAPYRRAESVAGRALDVDVTARERERGVRSRESMLVRHAEAAARVTPTAPHSKSPAHVSSASDLLRPELLAGLDVRVCECLVAEGVRTLGQLASAPPARLATLAGLPLALVTGLCADAARIAGGARVVPQVESTPGRALAQQRNVDVREVAEEPGSEAIVEWTLPRRPLAARPEEPPLIDVAGPFAGGVEELAAKDWLAARES